MAVRGETEGAPPSRRPGLRICRSRSTARLEPRPRGGGRLGCRLPPVKMSIRLTLGPRFFFLESHSDEMAIFRRRPPVGVCVKNALELWAASVACVDTFPLGCLPHARVPGGTGRCSGPLKLVVPDRRQTPHPQFGPCLLRALCVAPGSVQGSV